MRIAAFLIAFIYPLTVSAQDGADEQPASPATEHMAIEEAHDGDDETASGTDELESDEEMDGEEDDVLVIRTVHIEGEIERPSVEFILPSTPIEFQGGLYPSAIDAVEDDD